ncbi:MAG: hypothetical protein KDC95_19915 [Planctomycetes bacterium]|nr:hypothetical protein [Planctomycetota bacterium]
MARTHRTALSLSFAIATLACAATAQNCWYAPDNTPTVGTCNVFPWGQSSSRYQTLMTQDDLGNRVTLFRALAFAGCGSGTFTAQRILIRFAYFQGTTLGTDFNQNLGAAPVTMLNATNFSWSYTANTFSDLKLTGTFPYTPSRGHLLVDIEFEGATGGGACHRDVRQRVYANNWTGSPPQNGTSNFGALKMRVSDGNPCMTGAFTNYGKACGPGPLAIAGSGTPTINTTATIQMSKGKASSAGGYFLGLQRLNIDLTSAGMTNCTLNTDLLLILPVAFDGAGLATAAQIPIPADNSLVGAILNWSGFNLDVAANPRGITTADGLEMKISN